MMIMVIEVKAIKLVAMLITTHLPRYVLFVQHTNVSPDHSVPNSGR